MINKYYIELDKKLSYLDKLLLYNKTKIIDSF